MAGSVDDSHEGEGSDSAAERARLLDEWRGQTALAFSMALGHGDALPSSVELEPEPEEGVPNQDWSLPEAVAGTDSAGATWSAHAHAQEGAAIGLIQQTESTGNEQVAAASRQQLAGTGGIAIMGMLSIKYDTVYLPVGKHEGLPHFASKPDRHLYYCVSRRSWHLNNKFAPADSRHCRAYIGSADGLLPVGEHKWTVCCDGGDWKKVTVTVSLLCGEAEVSAAVERLRVRREQILCERDAAAKAAARAQLAEMAGVSIEGIRTLPEYNDVYIRCPVGHDGWPHFQTKQGKHLYYCTSKPSWYLNHKFTPADGRKCKAYVDCPDGLLPVGEHKWKVANGSWEEVSVTVCLLHDDTAVSVEMERLQVLREHMAADKAGEKAATLARTNSLRVDQYAGREFTEMYHGTDSRAAQLIVRSQRFRPSAGGLLGQGVYVTTSREKAEFYRNYHPMHGNPKKHGQHNKPLPNGEPDIGCVLRFRARMGVCRLMQVRDPLMLCWHETEVQQDDLSRSTSIRQAALNAETQFKSDLKLVRPYAAKFLSVLHRQLTLEDGTNDLPRLRIVYDSAFSPGCPCIPRCKGKHSCPKANGVLEEWCIFNPDRIDQIEIVDGPGTGDGPQYWELDPQDRQAAITAAAGNGWFDTINMADVRVMVEEWKSKQEAALEVTKAAAHGQLGETTAVCVEGLPQPDYNCLFSSSSEYEGWPRFESEQGKHLYFYTPTRRWYLNNKFAPSSPHCRAYIGSADGLLPVGEHKWTVCCDGGDWKKVTVTVSLLCGEAEVSAAVERLRVRREQILCERDAAAKAAARAQLAEMAGVSIEGIRTLPEYNDVYIRCPVGHDGWPHFQTKQGKHLYYCTSKPSWYLNHKFTPADGRKCKAYVDCPDGLLPVGEHKWKVANGSWNKVTVTVSLLCGEAEVSAAVERLRVRREQILCERDAAAKAAARAQLAEMAGVSIEGIRTLPEYNDVYIRCPVGHDGWPHFQTKQGKHLYYCTSKPSWYLNHKFTPADGRKCKAYVDCPDGLLPVGEHKWKVANGSWNKVTVTVSLLCGEAEVSAAVERLRVRR